MKFFVRAIVCALVGFIAVTVSAAGCGVAGQAEPGVEITVDLSSTVNRMASGVGASWHAIEDSIPLEGNTSHGGSAWGANPPPGDDAAWEQIYRHASWLGMDFCRVELERRMYEPEKGQFDWDNEEMRILYRILDWCERTGCDVFLQQMWDNVDWLAYPEFRGDPVKRIHSAPVSVEDFAAGIAELARYLVRDRGYTCIRWLSINNEPGHSWSWWQKPPNEPDEFTPALAAVRGALDERGLEDLPLSAPDWTDSPPLVPGDIDFDRYIGAYDIHSYYSRYDWQSAEDLPVDLPLSLVTERLEDWAEYAHERGKPFFLSEVGSMAFGWRLTDPGPNTFPATLKDAELVLRGMNVGVDAFNHWSFINRGDLDGEWQMINTWNVEERRLLEQFTPNPNSYFVYGLVSRFTAKRSRVLETDVGGGEVDSLRRVFTAALESPDGELTVIVVNDSPLPWRARVGFAGLEGVMTLYTYRVDETMKDNPELRIEPLEETAVKGPEGSFMAGLPPMSLTVYSTARLAHEDAGM